MAEISIPDTNRPYGPGANTVAVLHRLRTRNLPERIDMEYLIDAGIPEGTASRTLFALRFLGLISERGEPTQQLRTIHTSTDEEYRTTLEALVRNAYADVFNVVDPSEEGQERILNFFRRYTPASQRSRMVMFFLAMCRESGIPTLDTPRQRNMASAKPNRPGVNRPRSSAKSAPIQPPAPLSSMAPALEGLIMSLPAPGTPLTPDQRERWLKMAEATLAFIYPDFVPGMPDPSLTDDIEDEEDE